MIVAHILSPWKGTGTENDPYIAQVFVDHNIYVCRDVTAQPSGNIHPNPNLAVFEIQVAEGEFQKILANPNYGPGAVIWQNGKEAGIHTSQEYAALKSALSKGGMAATDVNTVLGATPGSKTRMQVSQTLIQWLKARPKG